MSDPNTPDIQRFEPLPDKRPSWKGALRGAATTDGDSATPERWLEQGTVLELESEPDPATPEDPPSPTGSGIGRGAIALVFAASLVGAAFGAGGTYAALRASGALDAATAAAAAAATAATGVASNLMIESDTSTVIAAVAAVNPAVVQIVTTDTAGNTGVGSGIVYDGRGWILTNKHVVHGVKSLTVRLKDGRRVPGTIYGLDTLTDLAIVKIDPVADLAVAPMGTSASLQVGELAIAIGSPLGIDYANSVSTGIVSALSRDISVLSDDPAVTTPTVLHGLIQTDAAISPGNSGGPLVNAAGKVVGVTTADAPTSQGIGFAIPIDIAKPIMQQALAGETLSRPFIGVTFSTISRGLADEYKLPLDQGAWVHAEDAAGSSIEAVQSGSPGDLAGIKTGDIITAVEGQTIDTSHQLSDVLVQFAPGRTISVEIYRGSAYLTVKVTLGTRPATVN